MNYTAVFEGTNPQPDNMGVSLQSGLSVHADWMTYTVWGLDFESVWFEVSDVLGSLKDLHHGGRWYRDTFSGGGGSIVRVNPIGEGGDRFSIEFPGEACQALGYERLQDFYTFLMREAEKVVINRIDIAVDNCPFVPRDIYNAICSNSIRTKTHRETVAFFEKPFEIDENQRIGTTGVTFGSRESERYLRCYTKHGYTRLEVEYKDWRAGNVACDFFIDCVPGKSAVAHMRDFFDILSEPIEDIKSRYGNDINTGKFLAPWWADFVAEIERAYCKQIKPISEVTQETIKSWIYKQVSGGIALLWALDENFDDWLGDVIEVGNLKIVKNNRYLSLLNMGR